MAFDFCDNCNSCVCFYKPEASLLHHCLHLYVFVVYLKKKTQKISRAATILRLLGNETIQSDTRGKKSEPGLRKQLNIDVKSFTKFYFFFKYMNIFIYFTNIRHFHFSILYFKYLQTLMLCVTTFYKTAFYYNVFRRRLKSRNIKMVKVSYILHYKCVFSPNSINYEHSFLLCGL